MLSIRRSLFSLFTFAFGLSLMIGLRAEAIAANFTWIGTVDGNWTTPANWGTSNYPLQASDTVVFPKKVKSQTITIYSGNYSWNAPTISISSLRFDDAYTLINNANLSLANAKYLDITGLAVASSSITNNYYLSFSKNINIGSIGITNNDYLDFYDNANAGTATITNNYKMYFNNTSVAGNAVITNSNYLYFEDSSNAGTSNINNLNDLIFSSGANAGSARITNRGTLKFSSYSRADKASIDNTHGTLDVSYMNIPLNIGSLYELDASNPGEIILAGKSLSLGDSNTDAKLYSTITGNTNSSLIKTGTGILTLYGTNDYSGKVNINQGKLIVANDAALKDSSITVSKGTFLNFINKAHSSYLIDNLGTLTPAPSDSLSTLKISNNFISRPGSSYQVKIDKNGNSDKLFIGATAILNGGTVVISLLDGQYKMATPYTILSAFTLTGTFDNLIQPAALTGELVYGENEVYYQINGLSNNLLSAASMPNQVAVAEHLLSNQPPLLVLNELMTMASVDQLQSYFDELSGAIYSKQQIAIAEAGNWLDSYMREHLQKFQQPGALRPWLVARVSEDRFGSFKNRPEVLAYGIETVEQQQLFGLGLACTRLQGHSVDSNEQGGARGNLYQLGAYANRKVGDYLLGATFSIGTLSKMDAKREIASGDVYLEAHGHYHGSLIAAQLEGTHAGVLLNKNTYLQPLLGARYQQFNRAQFAEQGNTGIELNLSGSRYKSLRSQLGVDLHAKLPHEIEPFAQATWEHELINTGRPLNVGFKSSSGDFSISNLRIGRETLVAKMGVAVSPQKNSTISVLYEGRFAKNLRENAAKFQLEYAFI